MRIVSEFKAFVMRGNVIDLAVGIMLGVAFGAVVTSLVNDVLMPPIGRVLGGVDFKDLFLNLSDKPTPTSLAEAKTKGLPTLNYGVFLNTVINFLIVAFALFVVVKLVTMLRKSPPPKDPTTKPCPECLTMIPLKATRCAACAIPVKA